MKVKLKLNKEDDDVVEVYEVEGILTYFICIIRIEFFDRETKLRLENGETVEAKFKVKK